MAKRRKKNPVDNTTYWLVFGTVVVGVAAIGFWNMMGEREKKKVLGTGELG